MDNFPITLIIFALIILSGLIGSLIKHYKNNNLKFIANLLFLSAFILEIITRIRYYLINNNNIDIIELETVFYRLTKALLMFLSIILYIISRFIIRKNKRN